MKHYKITETELKSLLLMRETLGRLKGLGVDNWDEYSEVNNTEYFTEDLDEFEENLEKMICEIYKEVK
jgi:hypothetical protein